MARKKVAKWSCVTYYYKLDGFRCSLMNFAIGLTNIQFGHICIGLLILIILISLFGRIKENYRWFILNQAFWDLLISYYYICGNELLFFIAEEYLDEPTCGTYAFVESDLIYLHWIFVAYIRTSPYSALFLLSTSRFLCLFFMNFYEKLTRKRRIFCLIIVFNLVSISLHVDQIFDNGYYDRIDVLFDECMAARKAANRSTIWCLDEKYENYKDFILISCDIARKVSAFIVYSKPLIFLFLSSLAAVAIIWRIVKQSKFQFKHNRNDFVNSFRISLVILLQTLINSFVFTLEFVVNLQTILVKTFGIELLNATDRWFCTADACTEFLLPLWLDGDFGLASAPVLQAIVQLRIFFESLITLIIMTGYREVLVRFVHCFYKIIRRPHKVADIFHQNT